MTVSEFIEELKRLPQNVEIEFGINYEEPYTDASGYTYTETIDKTSDTYRLERDVITETDESGAKIKTLRKIVLYPDVI